MTDLIYEYPHQDDETFVDWTSSQHTSSTAATELTDDSFMRYRRTSSCMSRQRRSSLEVDAHSSSADETISENGDDDDSDDLNNPTCDTFHDVLMEESAAPQVKFGMVQIYDYSVRLCINPGCRQGPAIEIDQVLSKRDFILEDYEETIRLNGGRRKLDQMKLTRTDREYYMKSIGYSRKEIEEATREKDLIRASITQSAARSHNKGNNVTTSIKNVAKQQCRTLKTIVSKISLHHTASSAAATTASNEGTHSSTKESNMHLNELTEKGYCSRFGKRDSMEVNRTNTERRCNSLGILPGKAATFTRRQFTFTKGYSQASAKHDAINAGSTKDNKGQDNDCRKTKKRMNALWSYRVIQQNYSEPHQVHLAKKPKNGRGRHSLLMKKTAYATSAVKKMADEEDEDDELAFRTLFRQQMSLDDPYASSSQLDSSLCTLNRAQSMPAALNDSPLSVEIMQAN